MINTSDFKHHVEELTIEEIKKYFKPTVFIEYCKACNHYNKIWTCPPYDFETKDIIDGYNYAYVIGSKIYLKDLGDDVDELISHRDIEYALNKIYTLFRRVLDKKLKTFEDNLDDIRLLLPGRCIICEDCTRENDTPCRYPSDMYYSLESIGFDVSKICEEVLEDKILWGRDSLPEYFILISGIFSKYRLDIKI